MDGFLVVVSFGNQIQKWGTYKFADMLSRIVVNSLLIMKNTSLSYDSYVKQYVGDDDLRDVYEALTKGIHNKGVDYHLHNNLLYHFGNICMPRDERVNVI